MKIAEDKFTRYAARMESHTTANANAQGEEVDGAWALRPRAKSRGRHAPILSKGATSSFLDAKPHDGRSGTASGTTSGRGDSNDLGEGLGIETTVEEGSEEEAAAATATEEVVVTEYDEGGVDNPWEQNVDPNSGDYYWVSI